MTLPPGQSSRDQKDNSVRRPFLSCARLPGIKHAVNPAQPCYFRISPPDAIASGVKRYTRTARNIPSARIRGRHGTSPGAQQTRPETGAPASRSQAETAGQVGGEDPGRVDDLAQLPELGQPRV